ncbi:roadblock/LC7 domain-containing protein [Methanobacterium congolense]|uniref:Roadblock/LC7 family protein n=1 Tax=Methanobacterium congolense TaxID=118062 RepID=A0A1D3L3I6_9EURY|nr:roadblock/LC7 domain-containing protein [Methanobacterium congolense]SCG86136.1 Roadblock/LC7 family protein [Methanobacterium congolense]
MKDPEIQNQLEKNVSTLNKVEGVDGSLIIDSNGIILYHKLFKRSEVSLFGSMANVITSSSRRLLNSTDQGEIERVLVESKNGKALFFHLGKAKLIVLMNISANLGMVMVSAKRAVKMVDETLRDYEAYEDEVPIESPENLMEEPAGESVETLQSDTPVTEEVKIDAESEITAQTLTGEVSKPEETLGVVVSDKTEESVGEDSAHAESLETDLKEFITSKEPLKLENNFEEKFKPVEASGEDSIKLLDSTEQNLDLDHVDDPKRVLEAKSSIPIIKPPINFPKLPENVEIPEDPQRRADLILDIYRSLFLAMSIGAGKIMGLAPAKGLTKKFLPVDKYPQLLEGVEVKNNSTIDFDRIKENAEKIPVTKRSEILIDNFSGIITVITESYGRVMGYGAFRGMVRKEFQVITNSYGDAMEELGIKDKIHPELINLIE